MATKTNAIRLIQQAKIPCRESFYEFDEKDLSGKHAAEAIGMPPEQVFKTLVARGEKTGINVFCIPVCCELDLKKAAKTAENHFILIFFVILFRPLKGPSLAAGPFYRLHKHYILLCYCIEDNRSSIRTSSFKYDLSLALRDINGKLIRISH